MFIWMRLTFIGAVGKTGRGVCELLGVDTADVDIMMETFTKSFGSCGGYIAGSKELNQYLKYTSPAHLYATSISPPAAQQIISSIKVILGEDGSSRGAQKLTQIRENRSYFRSELQKTGFEVLGDNETPVILGVSIGGGIGSIGDILDASQLICEKRLRRLSPFFVPRILINMSAGHVSMKYSFQGPNHAAVTACATGANSIGDAARMIQFGDADVMVAGGT